MTAGAEPTSPRLRALLALIPPGMTPVVDVGADHGLLAAAYGSGIIATERQPHRIQGPGRWVVADGLRPFRRVGVAVIAGMGARTIAAILEAGPRPDALVAHPQHDPPFLRAYLADHGWRIDAEALAPEAGGFAQVLRALPGEEPLTQFEIEFGPRLLAGSDPLRLAWLAHERARWAAIAGRMTGGEAQERAARRVRFLESVVEGPRPC